MEARFSSNSYIKWEAAKRARRVKINGICLLKYVSVSESASGVNILVANIKRKGGIDRIDS